MARDPPVLSRIQGLLLCGLWLTQLGLHRRNSTKASAYMHDLASRELSDWTEAGDLLGNGAFWEDAASYFRAHPMFSGSFDFTGDDLRLNVCTFYERLDGNGGGRDGSEDNEEEPVLSRLSWTQGIVVVCFLFDIHTIDPEFPDSWHGCGGDELDELADLLKASPLFELGTAIDGRSVGTWLLDLGTALVSLFSKSTLVTGYMA
ncbi:MAG: hypothetical protein M1813_009380 [Trichoglossum hirsutum]|nr:MAG: hypothetical protein M1813_009380 [Trichoglossum hirsutum]